MKICPNWLAMGNLGHILFPGKAQLGQIAVS